MDEEPVGYRKLTVWQRADDMARRVYLATRDFPKEETYGLTAQLRRAALSVPTNIVEGYGRQGRKELRHFVNISLGSLAETKYLLCFSSCLHYLPSEQHTELNSLTEEVGRLLWSFYKSLATQARSESA